MDYSYYIRLITDRLSIQSMLIRLGTRSWASHVELIACQKTLEREIPFLTLGSRLDDGVMIRDYNYCNPTSEKWYTAPGIEQAWLQLLALRGSKYDWKDIFGIALNRDWHVDGRFICSEAVAWAFEKAGEPLFNPDIPARRITPRDIPTSLKVKLDRIVK